MSNQYFENNDNLSSNESKINFYFKGQKMEFITDNGVFSKRGIDFGSSLLLKNLDVLDAKTMLDVGCGYGTIGLTIAKITPLLHVDLVDVNNRAIMLSVKNKMNNMINNAEIFVSDVYQNVDKKYDIIVSNPPIRAGKKIVHDISLLAVDHLNDNGVYWCVIQKKQGAQSLYNELIKVYSQVEIVDKDAGYWIIKSIK